jgi:hypothetical protein
MATTLIQLADGVLLEVDTVGEQVEPISGGMARRVNSSLASIEPILTNACKQIIAAWRGLDTDMSVQRTEIEMGLSFEGEGNAYITKARAGANIIVRLTLMPKAAKSEES